MSDDPAGSSSDTPEEPTRPTDTGEAAGAVEPSEIVDPTGAVEPSEIVDPTGAVEPSGAESSGLLRNSMVMGVGTLLSRALGFLKNAVIVATLGVGLTADLYMIPWTVPASMYFLIAGGVLNAVLVPQVVRAIKHDGDGGEAFTQRIWTAVVGILLLATVLLVVAAPLVIRLYGGNNFPPEQFDTMVAFARYCFPTVFFLGVFTVLSQILTAKGSFAPMAFAPILNNIVVIGVFGGFLWVYGPLDPRAGEYTEAEVAWFGLGSTAGLAAQALVLLPMMRKVGLRLRLRTDLRGTGLGKAASLGTWSVLFVVVNQIIYWVVVRVSAFSTVNNPDEAAGITVYTMAYTLIMVPHGVVTVSLATALLPQLSRDLADNAIGRASQDLMSTTRTALAIMVPASVAIVALSLPISRVLYGYGAATQDVGAVAVTLIMFAPGLVLFTIHFMTLRGFYAMEDTKTPFYNQVLLGLVNAGSAILLVAVLRPPNAAAFLALAWTLGYLAGTAAALVTLSRRLPDFSVAGILKFATYAGVASTPGAVLALGTYILTMQVLDQRLGAVVSLALGGLVGLLSYLAMARLLGIDEVGAAVRGITSRIRR